jgi:hypothetical protein
MDNTNPTTRLHTVRLRLSDGFVGHALPAPIFGLHLPGVDPCITPVNGMAQGRIVSISRGSPPPKKR